MSVKVFRQILIVMCVTLLAACADAPKTFTVESTLKGDKGKQLVWPDPPEKPRYRYVGELTGEANFISGEAEKTGNAAVRAFKWIVGLVGQDNREPVVLQRPQSGMVDADGRVFVTDVSRQAVFVFDRVAGKLSVWEKARRSQNFKAPIGIVQGAKGEILVVDAELHSVLRLDVNGKPLGEYGDKSLKRPTGVVRDAKRGRVYVADTYAHDIKVFADDGALLGVLGKRGEGDGEFNFPTYLAFSADRLYVTDSMNSRIQVLDVNGRMVQKFGQRGIYVGNLVRPKGIALDSSQNIYVVESLYDNMLVFDNTGRTLLALGGTGKDAGKFYLPAGIWTDSKDQIYIADMYNGRILILQFLGGS